MNQGRILIAGGGIAGLALSRALRRQGLPSTIIEARTQAVDGGLAINLPGNAIHALDRLGLGDRIRAEGRAVKRREYRTHSNRLMVSVDEAAFWGEALQPRAVRRSDLMRMLADDLPAADLRSCTALEMLEQDIDGITVHLRNGGTERADFVIGADGVRSTVRRATLGELPSKPALLAPSSWRFMAPNHGVDCWTLWTSDKFMVLLLPVDEHEIYGWAAITRGGSHSGDPFEMQRHCEQFPEIVRKTVREVLLRPESIYHSPIEEVRADRWSEGRVILIGDAAHATAPVWAQGGALAMEDALVLAAEFANQTDWSGVPIAYEAKRRPRVAHVQEMTDRISRTAQLPTVIRNLLLPFVGRRSYRATYGPLLSSL